MVVRDHLRRTSYANLRPLTAQNFMWQKEAVLKMKSSISLPGCVTPQDHLGLSNHNAIIA